MSLLFIFVDGIGIGQPGYKNPLSTNRLSFFEEIANQSHLHTDSEFINTTNLLIKPIDANLDMPGLPQSGTGQTALFTGKNGAEIVGRHFGPYPHSKLKPFLKEDSFFNNLKKNGKSPYFLNAYPPIFFEHAQRRNRWSCSTLMVKSSGQALNSTDKVMKGEAITAELMGDYWRAKLNINLPKRNPADVADIILEQTRRHDVTLLEYYLTDKAGHSKSDKEATDVLNRLDSVLTAIIKKMKSETIIISSDHGNLEDLSVKTHTRNPVPLIAVGPAAEIFSNSENIMDVYNGIMNYSHSI